jgi:hypothetical protein
MPYLPSEFHHAQAEFLFLSFHERDLSASILGGLVGLTGIEVLVYA